MPGNEGMQAVNIAFGEGLGWLTTPDSTYMLTDVHGAGCQRCEFKSGDPDDYPCGFGPQGDVVRICNLARCVAEMRNSYAASSSGTIVWNCPYMEPGVYSCVLQAGSRIVTVPFVISPI